MGSWVNKYVAFDGKANRELAAQFLALAQKQNSDVPRMIGHRLMGTSACKLVKLRRLERIMTLPSSSMILPDIDPWRADLAKTCEWRPFRIARCRCGYLAIPMPP